MIGSRTVTLRFPVNWLIGILVIAGALIGAFIWGPEAWRPSLIFTAAVLGGAGTLMAAFNALDTRVARLDQAKKAVSLQFICRWLAPEFYHAKKGCREVTSELKKRTFEEQMAYLHEDPARIANMIDVLNVFEALSIAIQTDIADDELARRFFRSVLIEFWHVTEGFVKARRAERQNARLLQDFEWLFKQWAV